MAAPSISGDPTIRQEGGSVFLEALVKSSSKLTLKWSKDEEAIDAGDKYKMSTSDEGGGRTKIVCEILNFDKPLAGVYKADFTNAQGANHATFNVTAGNAPDFSDKPHIAQRDKGAVLIIKVRAKSQLDATAEWFKDDKPVKASDRVKPIVKKDDKNPDDKHAYLFALEIHGPQKDDEAKYKCVVKNAEGQNSQSLNLNFD